MENYAGQTGCERAHKPDMGRGLTAEEKEEQFRLRSEYIAEFRNSLKSTLDNTYIQSPDGSLEKLQQKTTDVKH